MIAPKIKFRTTAVMETDLEYFFEMTQTEVDAAEKEYGSLEEYVKRTVDGGNFMQIEGWGAWNWGEVDEIYPEDEDEDEE